MPAPPKPTRYQQPSEQTLRRHEQVDALQYVQEKLVAPILDALATPADLPGHLAGDLGLLLFSLTQERTTSSRTTRAQTELNEEQPSAARKSGWLAELRRGVITWCWCQEVRGEGSQSPKKQIRT